MPESIPTRRCLLNLLKDRDGQSSWQECFDTDIDWRLICNVTIKSGALSR